MRPRVFVGVPSVDESFVLGEETPAGLAFPVVVAATSNSSLVKRTVVLSRVRVGVRRRAWWAPEIVDGGLGSRVQHGTRQVIRNGRRSSSPVAGIRLLLLGRVGILLRVLLVLLVLLLLLMLLVLLLPRALQLRIHAIDGGRVHVPPVYLLVHIRIVLIARGGLLDREIRVRVRR